MKYPTKQLAFAVFIVVSLSLVAATGQDFAARRELEGEVYAIEGEELKPEVTLELLKQLLEVNKRLPMNENREVEIDNLEDLIQLGSLDEKLCDEDDVFEWYREIVKGWKTGDIPYINLGLFVKYYADKLNREICGFDTDSEFEFDSDNNDDEDD